MEIFLAEKKAKCKMVSLWLFITSATNVEPFFVYYTAWKVSKYGVISGPNTGKYGPEITPYLDTFHAVLVNIGSIKVNETLIHIDSIKSAR